MFSYSYSILRYTHDPAVGETVNVGLLMYSPEAKWVRFYSDTRYGHLSNLFRGFNHEDFKRSLSWLEGAVERLQHSMDQHKLRLFQIDEILDDAGMLTKKLIPDQGLNFHFSRSGAGLTKYLETTGQDLFERMISSQRKPSAVSQRRDDHAVWDAFRPVLRNYGITRALRPYTVQTSTFEIPFDHAFKNEKWHAVVPISFDYQDSATIRDRAMRWLGYGEVLAESANFSDLYMLLGAPSLESHKKYFEVAKSAMLKMRVRPHLIEEDSKEDFARSLSSYMLEHGVFRETPALPEESAPKQPTFIDKKEK